MFFIDCITACVPFPFTAHTFIFFFCIEDEEWCLCICISSLTHLCYYIRVCVCVCVCVCCALYVVDEQDSWYCSTCKDHVQASKKMELWRMPDLLVVHLKRFKKSMSMFGAVGGAKNSTYVDFPLDQLDLTEFVSTQQGYPPHYQLYAVINHIGELGYGHYTAYIKKADTYFKGIELVNEPNESIGATSHSWYSFNDSSVSKIPTEKIDKKNAYVLFYRRSPGWQAGPPVVTTTATATATVTVPATTMN
jgi:ubiquitin C-terminal hydrolase